MIAVGAITIAAGIYELYDAYECLASITSPHHRQLHLPIGAPWSLLIGMGGWDGRRAPRGNRTWIA
jgi:hypothetical protein